TGLFKQILHSLTLYTVILSIWFYITRCPCRRQGQLFLAPFGFVLPAYHGVLALFPKQRSIFLQELPLSQRQAFPLVLHLAEMGIQPLLQFLLDGVAHLADVSVRLAAQLRQLGGAV